MKKTYGMFKVTKESFIIESCEPHVAIALKRIFPKIPTYATAPFEMPATKENAADLEWFFQRYPLKMSSYSRKQLLAKKGEFLEHQAEIERILSPNYKPKNFKFLRDGQKVRKYQAQAVNVLWKNGYLLLGDDLGLGKTYSSIAAAMRKEALPAIMVVQTHLPKQWEEKVKEFSNFKTHFIHQRTPYSLPEADIYIIKYSSLQGWVDVFREGFLNWLCSMRFKNYDAVRNHQKECRRRFCASMPITLWGCRQHRSIIMQMSYTIYTIFSKEGDLILSAAG